MLTISHTHSNIPDLKLLAKNRLCDSPAIDIKTIKKYLKPSKDVVDNPSSKPRNIQDYGQSMLFEIMRYEQNRLLTYKQKWPLDFILPKDLAEAGLFYLQSSDKVQCAFCYGIICDWTQGDRPIKEHVRNFPMCPFLIGKDVGNVSVSITKPLKSEPKVSGYVPSCYVPYKPKHPVMSDEVKRVETYKNWPLVMLKPEQLAQCGLFYTGIADMVTCFFCGGSLGKWDIDDNPWVEHEKFFPDCGFLHLEKTKQHNANPSNSSTLGKVYQANTFRNENLASSESYFINKASEIFPKPLVQQAIKQRIQTTGSNFMSLQELCNQILSEDMTHKEVTSHPEISKTSSSHSHLVNGHPRSMSEHTRTASPTATYRRDAILCKICMDQEMGVVFQPCGHLISCLKCAKAIKACPVCRMPITSTIRTYLS